jgi:hypothetical protein
MERECIDRIGFARAIAQLRGDLIHLLRED